jgi:hypothetical protein
MKRNIVLVLVALALIASIIACGGSGAGTIRVVNHLSIPVCFVQMSPSSQSTWGNDWLGSQEVIESGHSRSFTVPTNQGTYDIRLSACPNGAQTLFEDYNLPVDTQAVTVTVQ